MAATKRKYTKRAKSNGTASSTTNGSSDVVKNAGRKAHKAGKVVRKNAVIAAEKARNGAMIAAGVAVVAASVASTSVRNFVTGLFRG